MFRVECTSCKAAYQVDERRVPAKGLTMKCPKCRESFLVSPPDKPVVPVEKVAVPAPNFGGTMIGVSAKRDLFGGRSADPSNQTQIGLPGPRAMKGNDATMIGVAPSSSKGTPEGSSDLPVVRSTNLHTGLAKTGKTQELPVSSPPGPLSKNTQDTAAELPAIKGSKTPTATGTFAAVAAKKASRINLPSLSPSARTEPNAASGGPLPSTAAPATKSGPAIGVTEAELPAVVTKAKTGGSDVGRTGELSDLPAVIDPLKPASGGQSSLSGGSATSRLHKPTSPELPSARMTSRGSGESVDLFEMDLPAVFSERGPAASSASPPPAKVISNVSPLSGSITQRNVASPMLGHAIELDEPSRKPGTLQGAGADRNTARVEPTRDDVVDLDSEGVSLESLAPSQPPLDADLPEVVGLDLPDVLGGTALPALPKELDDAGLGFGELDLPTIGTATTGRVLSERAPVDFTTKLPSFAPSEPPNGSVSSQPPSFRARQDSFGEFEGVPSFAPSTSHPRTGGELTPEDFDSELFEGESFSLSDERSSIAESGRVEARASSRPPKPALTQASDEEYGQVNLDAGPGGGADSEGDEMEFGGIPQADSAPPKGIAVDGHGEPVMPAEPVVAPVPAARSRVPNGGAPAKATRTGVKVAVVAAVMLSIGGGALALLPEIGPFGVHAAQDLLSRGEHQALLARLSRAVEEARSLDNYQTSVAALRAMDEGRAAARRFMPLKSETAAQSLSLALRFGGPASVQSTGRVLLDELKASQVERTMLLRALAVDLVLKRDASAASELAALPRDLFSLTVEGEHWLQLENVDNALASWTEAITQRRCAWTLFGLARSYLAGHQIEPALVAAGQVLELNPQHVGAKLLQVDGALRAGNLEPSVQATLASVLQESALASPAEIALAHTLVGEFEFASGRTTKALEAYEAALEVLPGDSRALVSSAKALFASGRHAAALARYQAAATATPHAVAPKVGIARAQLALQQLDQAAAQIQALRAATPTDIEVTYLAGVASLDAGDVESGRKALQQAIDASKKPSPPRFSPREFQRVAVDAYVALATSFSKAGEPERAALILDQAAVELPGSSALRIAMGDVAYGQGQYEKALAEYTEARRLAPTDTAASFKVGQTLSRLRRFEEATVVFDEVAQTDASYPGLPLERGLILDKSGKAAEALAEYEQALKHDPEDLDIQLRVGCGRVEAGLGTAAAAILKDVMSKRPRSAEANYCLGRAMFALGSNVEALRLMRSAVEFDANNALYRLHLGWVASEMGQVAVARRELNRALELDQGSVDGYWQRGLLNLKQGAARDASVDFKKALELNPSHSAANADMAQALIQVGKEQESLPYWEKAIAGNTNNATWLFRYGKALVGRHQGEKGTQLLLQALKLVAGQTPQPNWLWQAHYLVAFGLGNSSDASTHWRHYLELSPHDSPFRGEAKRALAKAGTPWEGP